MTNLDTPILFLATSNPQRSRAFYERVVGLKLVTDDPFALVFAVGGSTLRIQKVERMQPPPYTALGWTVRDIRTTIHQLRDAGAVFERYEGMAQDADLIWLSPSGAQLAWFKDPDGQTLSLTQLSENYLPQMNTDEHR